MSRVFDLGTPCRIIWTSLWHHCSRLVNNWWFGRNLFDNHEKISELSRMLASHLSHNGVALATTNVLHAISRECYSRSPQNSSKWGGAIHPSVAEVRKSIRQRTEQLTNNSLIIGELPESQIAIRVPHSVLQQGCEVFVADWKVSRISGKISSFMRIIFQIEQ